jgi:hypothetical protein
MFKGRVLAWLSLFGLSLCVFLGKSQDTSLQALDSTTHAILALEVTTKGPLPALPMANFVTNHRPETTFNDHPFTLFYLVGWVMRAFGSEAWSVRLLPALFSAGSVVLTAAIGSVLYSPATGLVAGLILLMSRDFVLIGSRFHLDTPMIFFILLSFLLWLKKFPMLAGVAAGIGLWMKSPVSYLLFPVVLLTGWVSRYWDRSQLRIWILAGAVSVFTGFLIWAFTGWIGGWDLVRDYWTRQVWGTAVEGRGSGGPVNLFWGLELLFRHYLPWVLLLPFALFRIWRSGKARTMEYSLPLIAFAVLETVLSFIRFKHYWYFLPVFPFLALILSGAFSDFWDRHSARVSNSLIFFGLSLPVILVCFPVALGPESFPGLRKFNPLIQSYGSCQDHVLFIDGGQPFGTALDSIYELSFYTGRKILQARDCQEAIRLITTRSPEWIVMTTRNPTQCIPGVTLAHYPVYFQFGDQYLYSRIIPETRRGDLTPLHRELKPPRECVSAPEPKDLYFPRLDRS